MTHPWRRLAAALPLSLAVLVAFAAPAPESDASAPPADGARDAPAQQPVFDILEYRIEGNTALPAIAVERAVTPHLGPGRTAEDVQRAAQALEKAYQNAGFLTVVVGIPEQKVDDGVVVLEVTEGAVNRLSVKGARRSSSADIRRDMPSVAEGTVPYFPQVQDELARLNRRGDRKVTPVLKSAPVAGFVDIDLKVEDSLPVHGSVELNNRYIANTEPLRLSASVRYDNLWQRGHGIGVSFLTSPQDTSQVRVLSGSYTFPGWADGSIVALYGTRSFTDIVTSPTLGVVGRGNVIGGRYIVPLPPRGTFSQAFTLGADYKDFSESTSLGSGNLQPPITYVPLTAQYTLRHNGRKGVTSGTLGATFGMRDVLGNSEQEFAARQYRARANFFAVRADVQREQSLPRGYGLVARVIGQMSSGPLLSTEQFFASGADVVRGYLEGEVLGDQAVATKLEARTPSLGAKLGSALDDWTALVFLDAARVQVHEPLQPTPARTDISSAGVGLRARGDRGLAASVDLAWPLASTRNTSAGDPRLQFRFAYDF